MSQRRASFLSLLQASQNSIAQEGDGQCDVEPACTVAYVSEDWSYAESVASRIPAARKRGSIVGFLMDPIRRVQIYFESILEFAHLVVLVINPNILEIREQARLPYFDGQGRRHYTADFHVHHARLGWVVIEGARKFPESVAPPPSQSTARPSASLVSASRSIPPRRLPPELRPDGFLKIRRRSPEMLGWTRVLGTCTG